MKDIERDIFKKENRREISWDDDIAVMFYDGEEIIKGTIDSLRESCLHTDSIVYNPDEYTKYPYIYNVINKKVWCDDSKSYKLGLWEIIVLDI